MEDLYGPFPSRVAAERFSEDMLDLFKLRRCVEDLAPDPAFPGCVYSEMKKCLAPCFKGCTDERYEEEAQAVRAFLRTRGGSLVETLRKERDGASELMEFEKAAELHARLTKAEAVAAAGSGGGAGACASGWRGGAGGGRGGACGAVPAGARVAARAGAVFGGGDAACERGGGIDVAVCAAGGRDRGGSARRLRRHGSLPGRTGAETRDSPRGAGSSHDAQDAKTRVAAERRRIICASSAGGITVPRRSGWGRLYSRVRTERFPRRPCCERFRACIKNR